MSSIFLIEMVVLGTIAVLLLFRLKSLLGTRDGFEKTPIEPSNLNEREYQETPSKLQKNIMQTHDNDMQWKNIAQTIQVRHPDFQLGKFIDGASKVHEIITEAYFESKLETVRHLVADPVFSLFNQAVSERKSKNYILDTQYIGIKDAKIKNINYNEIADQVSISIDIHYEIIFSLTCNGELIEGDPKKVVQKSDSWKFERMMNQPDPVWILTQTNG